MSKFFLGLSLFIAASFTGCSAGYFSDFVTADKDKLMDGDDELRFVSFNIPNLHYIEDQLAFGEQSPWRLPDEFEIRDALNAVKQLDGKVIRIYVFSVRKPSESKLIIRHVEAPGVFNEEAFRALDKVLQVANETGIRIIIPFVDNWHWWGGPAEYAAFRGKSPDQFWTDSQIISDLKTTIQYVINRRNIYTGTLYKDDKAILGWETGNELGAPYSWTKEIAAYIKSLDKNHLVIEGTRSSTLTNEALQDPNIDVLSTHHYSRAPQAIERIKSNREFSKGKKPYFVGEFGLVPFSDMRAIVDSTIKYDVSGIMAWSLRFHNRDGGFYMHRENTGSGPYRFPGFSSGNLYDEKEVIDFIRNKAYTLDGKAVPPLNIPAPPVLNEITDIYSISWKGSTGAQFYIVERKESESGSWNVVADGVSEAQTGYKPLYADTSAVPGKLYFYRVTAANTSGKSQPSNEAGPVKCTYLKIIDELSDESKLYNKEGNLVLADMKDVYRAKEDNTRLIADSASSVVYKAPGDLLSFTVFFFSPENSWNVSVQAADSSGKYLSLAAKIETFPPYRNEYNFFTPVRLTCSEFPANTKYLKILFNSKVQLSRTETEYLKNQNKLQE